MGLHGMLGSFTLAYRLRYESTHAGGPGVCGDGCFFEKTYTNLPLHEKIYIEVFYFTIDSWDQNDVYGRDFLRILIDGTSVCRCYPYAFGDNGPGYGGVPGGVWTDLSLCGHGIMMDLGPYVCPGFIFHTASSVTVRIQSGLDQFPLDESLGVVAVKVYLQ